MSDPRHSFILFAIIFMVFWGMGTYFIAQVQYEQMDAPSRQNESSLISNYSNLTGSGVVSFDSIRNFIQFHSEFWYLNLAIGAIFVLYGAYSGVTIWTGIGA